MFSNRMSQSSYVNKMFHIPLNRTVYAIYQIGYQQSLYIQKILLENYVQDISHTNSFNSVIRNYR